MSVRFPRRARRGVILGLSGVQVGVLGVALGVLVVAVATAQGWGLVLALPLAAVAAGAAVVPVRGRPVVEWVPTVGAAQARSVMGQSSWRARPSAPEVAGSLGLPGSAASLRVIETPGGHAAVFDPHRRWLMAVVKVSAPAFVLLSRPDQARRVDAGARVLAGLSRSGGVVRLQVLERSLPDSGDALAQWWGHQRRPDDGWAPRVYGELIAAAGPTASRHETFLTLAVDATAARGGSARSKLDDAVRMLEAEQQSLVRGLLASGMTVEGWLAPRDLAAVVRVAYDPAAGVVLDRRVRLDNAGVRVEAAGPMAVDEEWSVLRSDSGWHVTYWIAEWPRIEVHASFLHPLLYAAGRRTLSVVMEPVATDRALQQIRSEQVGHLVDEEQRRRIGQVTTEAQRREADDVAQRERELVAGHGELRFAGFVTVSAETRAVLEDACGAVETAATQAMVDLRRLDGQQAEAFLAGATPFAMGLR